MMVGVSGITAQLCMFGLWLAASRRYSTFIRQTLSMPLVTIISTIMLPVLVLKDITDCKYNLVINVWLKKKTDHIFREMAGRHHRLLTYKDYLTVHPIMTIYQCINKSNSAYLKQVLRRTLVGRQV